jgi:hypothetical protein
MMRPLLVLISLAYSFICYSQTNYRVSFHNRVGNPDSLNLTADDDVSSATWTTFVNAGVTSNLWSNPVQLPFAFNFYGNPVATLRASTNGLITFSTLTSPKLPDDNENLPTSSLPDSTIACFWDAFTSLPPTAANDVMVHGVFGTAPNRQFWIKWVSFEIGAPANNNVTFACVLEETTNNIYLVEGIYSRTLITSASYVSAGIQLDSTNARQYDTKFYDRENNVASAADNSYIKLTPYAYTNMAVVNLDAAQPITKYASIGGVNNEIVRVKITTQGHLNPLSISDLQFSTLGTNPSNIVSTAKVYYTLGDSNFNTYGFYGSTSNPIGNFTVNGSQTLAEGDNYFWLAYDLPSTVNPGSVMDGEFTGVTISGTPYYSTVQAMLGERYTFPAKSGRVTIGPTGHYALLSQAFKDISDYGLNGDLVIEILADIEDTGAAILDFRNPSNFKIRIEPSSGGSYSIRAVVKGTYLDIRGTTYLTIDGSNPATGLGKNLRIVNYSDSGATIKFSNGARFDSITNCVIEGTCLLQDRGVIHIAGTNNYDSNRDIVIHNNNISSPSDSAYIPAIMIYSEGEYLQRNSHVTISNNNIFNYNRSGVYVNYIGNAGGWKVNGNSFYYNHVIPQPGGFDLVSLMLIPGALADTNQVHNNYFGGTAPLSGGLPWLNNTGNNFVVMNINAGIEYGTSIQGNTIQNINLTATSGNAFVGIRLESGSNQVGTITPNIVGSTTVANSISSNLSLFMGIYSFTQGRGVLFIENNKVANITGLHTGSAAGVRGICIQRGATFPTIANNEIFNLKSASTGTSATTNCVSAISVVSGNELGRFIIRNNKCYNIESTANATGGILPAGIIVDHSSTDGLIEGNIIYNIKSKRAGATAAIHGLYITGGVKNWTVRNNMIALNNDNDTARIMIRGITDHGSNNTIKYYYNTVYIGGAIVDTANSFAFERRQVNSIPELRNNIFYNERTSAEGVHAAIANVVAATNWSSNMSGYNLLVSSNASTIGAWTASITPHTFASWQTLTNGDKTSWSDTAANIPADSLFINKAIANLSIDSTKSHVWYVKGKGIALQDENLDKDNQLRSVTIATGATDIGADEITANATSLPQPPAVNVLGNIAVGDATTLAFAGRNLATIYWKSGVLPSSISAKYYSGITPATPLQTGAMFNSYIDLNVVGGNNYLADVKQFYDSAVFGAVSSSASVWNAAYVSNKNEWHTYPPVLNMAERSVLSYGVVNFTKLSGSDVTSLVPVKLNQFVGLAVDNNVKLTWTTSSEKNANRFEVEVSVDQKEFTQVGNVTAVGNSSLISNYQFIDEAAFDKNNTNTLFYRLKMIDNDGTYEYSKTVVVERMAVGVINATLSPNPFTENTTLMIETNADAVVDVEVVDMHGKLFGSHTINVMPGVVDVLPQSIKAAPKGIYFITITLNGERKTVKLVK